MIDPTLEQEIVADVLRALAEDVGSGDITAQLIAQDQSAEATVITREAAVICGRPWVDEVFRQLDPKVELEWQVSEGEEVQSNQALVHLKGTARSLLTGERTALNFLQLLSGTATRTRKYADLLKGTKTRLLDTRKTIPGLRLAQKYAVKIGGGTNHRLGLYDAFLIKENHIAACGGIHKAVTQARQTAPGKPVEVEVENEDELRQALDAGADTIMLDNFSLEATRQAVLLTDGKAKLEASGNISEDALTDLARTGIDYISSGALTKHCRAVDLSMLFV